MTPLISAAASAVTSASVITALGTATGPVSFNGQAITNVASVTQPPATTLTIGGNTGAESLFLQSSTTITAESPSNIVFSSYSGTLTLESAARTPVITLTTTPNLLLFGGAGAGGGVLVVSIANCATTPNTNPTGGGLLYVEAGTLKYKGPSGTVTPLGLP